MGSVSRAGVEERTRERTWGGSARVVGRGVLVLAGAGAALGGVAGTLDWPLVGTFFGGLEAAAAGAVVGVIDGLVLSVLVGRTRSPWAARVISGAVSALASVVGALAYEGPVSVPRAVEVVLVVAAVLVGAVAGPLIAYGAATVCGGRRGQRPLPELVGLLVAWGVGLGAGVGAVAGGIVGAFAYLPTAPFAVVEGAVLGSVTGAVLACLAAGIAVVSRSLTAR
jgi:hypothetical protein